MNEDFPERKGIDPLERLKEDFRTIVATCYGRDALNPRIKLFVDREGHGVDIEDEIPGSNPGQRMLIYTTYYLNLSGELSKEVDSENAMVRLARDIRSNSVNGSSEMTFDQEVDYLSLQAQCSREEAARTIVDLAVSMASDTTIKALLRYLEARAEQEELGLNTVDAFELRDVIEKIRGNFPLAAA